MWRKSTPELRSEVIGFWAEHQLLPDSADPNERALEVVLIVRDVASRRIVGLSTAAVVQFKQLANKYFYLYRSVIAPSYRIPGLDSKLMVDTRDFLEQRASEGEGPGCIGVLTFVENPAIIKVRNEAVWPASQMVFIGNDSRGREIRVYYFKRARI